MRESNISQQDDNQRMQFNFINAQTQSIAQRSSVNPYQTYGQPVVNLQRGQIFHQAYGPVVVHAPGGGLAHGLVQTTAPIAVQDAIPNLYSAPVTYAYASPGQAAFPATAGAYPQEYVQYAAVPAQHQPQTYTATPAFRSTNPYTRHSMSQTGSSSNHNSRGGAAFRNSNSSTSQSTFQIPSQSVLTSGYRTPDADQVVGSILAGLRHLSATASAVEYVLPFLSRLDSRALSSLLKQLHQQNQPNRAMEVFNFLRSTPSTGPYAHLRGLLDVYVYTAVISMCAHSKQVELALELSTEMEQRSVRLNVHTYSALMNVAVKAGRPQLALEVYNRMQQAGCSPNLVTYNTLIDVHGKLGMWGDAIQVLGQMRERNVEPNVRTYNTLMIACTASGKWQEALQVYQRMQEAGHRPNTTTYNALISAYSKADQLDSVMAIFADMVDARCERSVITYSTLISACERAGKWDTALQLFERMPSDGVQPNTITYNSLITACAQGQQWKRAVQLFDDMVSKGHQPDVVSYTALISACGRSGQWRRALQAFSTMQSSGTQADHIVYETTVDALWATGVKLPQERALQVYQLGVRRGVMRHVEGVGPGSAVGTEITITASTQTMMMISMAMLLLEQRENVLARGQFSLPAAGLEIRLFGKGRIRDLATNPSFLTTLAAWCAAHSCPLKVTLESNVVVLTATRAALGEWLAGNAASGLLPPIPPASQPPARFPLGQQLHVLDVGEDQQESRYAADDAWCAQAWQAIQQFEAGYHMPRQADTADLYTQRKALLHCLKQVGMKLGVPCEQLYDAMLLLDQAVSKASPPMARDRLQIAVHAALLIVNEQAARRQEIHALHPSSPDSTNSQGGGSGTQQQQAASPAGQDVLLDGDLVAPMIPAQAEALRNMQSELLSLLPQGPAAVSAVHTLRLFHFCLRYSEGQIPPPENVMVDTPQLPYKPLPAAAIRSMASATGSQAASSSASASPTQQQRALPSASTGGQHDAPQPGEAGAGALRRGSESHGGSASQAATVTQMPNRAMPILVTDTSVGGSSSESDVGVPSPAGGSESHSREVQDTQTTHQGSLLSERPWQQPATDEYSAVLQHHELYSYQLLHLGVEAGDLLDTRPSRLAAAAMQVARQHFGLLPLWPTALSMLTEVEEGEPEVVRAIHIVQRRLHAAQAAAVS